MTGRMNWDRIRRYRGGAESKFGSGAVLANGAVTRRPPQDHLAHRAEQTMRAWSRNLSKRDRALFEPRAPGKAAD